MIGLAGRNFDKGYVSDKPRDQLGPNQAFRMLDWIPDLDAALRKRGGWSFSTTDLNNVSAASKVSALAWAPFSGDPHLVIVASNGKVYFDKTFNGLGGSFVGSTGFTSPTHEPVFHLDLNGLVILQGLGQTATAPQKYYSTGPTSYALAALGGGPPMASVGASWGDYLLLANGYVGTTRFPNRMWISGVGTPEVWSTGTAIEDFPAEILKIVPLWNTIMVFGYQDVWVITGDTPPPGGNWSQKTVFKGNGVMDGRTCAPYQNFVIWANDTGVYKSDGFSFSDLTLRGGIKQRWQELVGSFNPSTGWSAAAGVYRGHYIIVVYDNNGNFVTAQVCDIDTETWFEFTNFPAFMFAQRFSGPGTANAVGSEELFFGHRSLARVGKVSSCWTPSATYASDGDGLDVLPAIETPFYKLSQAAKKQIRRAYFTYDIRSAGGAPYLQASAVMSPEEGAAYTALPGTLPTTTAISRQRLEIRERGYGVGLKLQQVGASADTRLSDIELDLTLLEGMR